MSTEYNVPTGSVPRVSKTTGQGIGDLNSKERGSAARYNAGKAAFHLLPLRAMVDQYAVMHHLAGSERMDTVQGFGEQAALECLRQLAAWQETGKMTWLVQAFIALEDCWVECSQAFEYGLKKYNEWNWAKGFMWSVPLASAVRHLKKILDGEEFDEESGLPHRGHVYANLVMLHTFIRTYPEGDDRPRCLAPLEQQ